MQLTGPNYETPAEIRMCRSWGGDAVGMSTACEAMAARHMGMEIGGISCITNLAAGMSKQKLDHMEAVSYTHLSLMETGTMLPAQVEGV